MTLEAVPVTHPPKHHFFGYYEKCPWDASGRYMLAGEVDFMDRDPGEDDVLTVGVIDLQDDCRFTPVGQTTAWHWQVGCRLQWVGEGAELKVLYNDRRDGKLVAVVCDVDAALRSTSGGGQRVLPLPISEVSHDGTSVIVPDMHRVHRYRPGYGIATSIDYALEERAPADQGIYRMDVATGEFEQIVSLADVAAFEATEASKRSHHWINHLVFTPGDGRFAFLHRYTNPDMNGTWMTRMFTVDPDGSDLFLLNAEPMTSHFDWFDDEHLFAWATHDGQNAYYLFTDRSRAVVPIGLEHLPVDGHCSFSPDRRWLLTDTYPDRKDSKRTLILYRWPAGPRIDIGRFFSPPELAGPKRCDLHPRWNRDGTRICIDSAHAGSRQMYVLDVSDIVGT